jgi:hypothetical protein
MAFPDTGHFIGIKSESNLIKYKSEIEKHFSKDIVSISQIGGTKTKVDNIITFVDGTKVEVSLKNKKSVKTGSFDYVNTSSFDWMSSGFSKTFEVYNKFKNSKNTLAYSELTKTISSELVEISSELLTKLYKYHVIDKYTNLTNLSLMIIDEKTKSIHCDVLPKSFKLIQDGGMLSIRKSEGVKMSYIIDGIDKDGNKVETGLRIRVHLNNGKTKWIGQGSSNLVVKFQQDKVYSII